MQYRQYLILVHAYLGLRTYWVDVLLLLLLLRRNNVQEKRGIVRNVCWYVHFWCRQLPMCCLYLHPRRRSGAFFAGDRLKLLQLVGDTSATVVMPLL